jgi:threonine dehydrogenase-like Zn-dependent dehydrogenase
MRELVVVPAEKVHTSVLLSFDQLALVETLSVGMHAASRAGSGSGESVLVVGAGPIGLGVALQALRLGDAVTIADTDEGRLRFAATALDGARLIRVREGRGSSMRRSLGKRLPMTVFDATGSRQSMQKSIQLAAPGGCVVFVGLTKGRISFDDAAFHSRELRLLATRNATAADFRATIRVLEEGRVDAESWFTNRTSWDSVVAQFSAWAGDAPPEVKAVLEF